jgi:hypothetical protein
MMEQMAQRQAAMQELAARYEADPGIGRGAGLAALGRNLGPGMSGFTRGMSELIANRDKMAEREYARQAYGQKVRAESEMQDVTDLQNIAKLEDEGRTGLKSYAASKPFRVVDPADNQTHEYQNIWDVDTQKYVKTDMGVVPEKELKKETKGWQFYTDGADTFRANPNLAEGGFQKQTSEGWEPIDEAPTNLKKLGVQGSSALNQRFAGRVIGASNEGLAALSTIAGMGDPNTGVFGSKIPGNIFSRTGTGILAPEQAKRYNATLAGLAVEIATAQNQGMIPNEAQIKHVEDAITIQPTDDETTKKYRVALAARYLEKALETSHNLASEDQRKSIEELRKKLKEFPDPNKILDLKPEQHMFTGEAAKPKDGEVRSTGPVSIYSDEDYDALPSGTVFIPPGGGKPRRKP